MKRDTRQHLSSVKSRLDALAERARKEASISRRDFSALDDEELSRFEVLVNSYYDDDLDPAQAAALGELCEKIETGRRARRKGER